MDTNALAKLMAGEAISQYTSEYFKRLNARYLCVLENFLHGSNRNGQPNIIFEFRVIEAMPLSGFENRSERTPHYSSLLENANAKGASTKIIYGTESWNLKKCKNHLRDILGVSAEVLNDPEKGAQLIAEALEPRAEKDGKSILAGKVVLVTTTLENTEARRREGKDDFVTYSIQCVDNFAVETVIGLNADECKTLASEASSEDVPF